MTNMRGWAPLVALLLVCLAPEGAQPARRQLQQREVGKLQGACGHQGPAAAAAARQGSIRMRSAAG